MAGLFFLGGPLTTTKHIPSHHHHNNKDDDADDEDHHLFFTAKETINHQLWSSEESYFALRVGPGPPFDDQLTGSGLAAMMMRSGRSGAGAGGGGGGGVGGINCQDCGNQAKKDCPHLRCRTCCKGRGLPCSTHVKSTWVPAAKRRERQQQQQLAAMQQQQEQQQLRSSQNVPKRAREDHHQMLTLPPLSYPTASTGLEGEDFPSELNSPALFRCVKVSAMEEEDEEYAYQTALNIGGHVFKGILYDQGPDQTSSYPTVAGESSSRGGSGAQALNLITTATTATTTNNNVTPTNLQQQGPNLVDPSSSQLVYPAPLSGFMGIGTQFFPPPRS